MQVINNLDFIASITIMLAIYLFSIGIVANVEILTTKN